MRLGYNIIASTIVASLVLSLGLVIRQAANQPIDQQYSAWILPFSVTFLFCMITLSYTDKKVE